MRQALVAVVSAALLGGCGGRDETPARAKVVDRTDWRAVATNADRERLRSWRTVWLDAVGRARAAGAGRELVAEGVLFDPDVALVEPMPPVGEYRCRVFKLGAKRAGERDFVVYPADVCRVAAEGDMVSFHKAGGAQRPVGLLFPDEGKRAVFLGTLLLGDETRALMYGRDRTRDMAGFVDRIGERRWRIVLPLPAFESTLDLIELVPVG